MADYYLLDTCVVNERDDRVTAWLDTVDDDKLFLSVISIVEARKGIENLRPKKPGVAEEIEADLLEWAAVLDDRVLHVDQNIAHVWGRVLERNPKKNRTDTCFDSAIIATATGRFTVATRNEKDFVGQGVVVLNPFHKKPKLIPIE